MNLPAKFEVRSFTRSWDNRGYLKTLGSSWIRPGSLFYKMFNGLLFGWTLWMYQPNLNPYSFTRSGSPMLWSARAWTLSYLAVKLFSKYSNLCDHGTWTSRTEGQTDRQTTHCGITALCVASRGKNSNWQTGTAKLPFTESGGEPPPKAESFYPSEHPYEVQNLQPSLNFANGSVYNRKIYLN